MMKSLNTITVQILGNMTTMSSTNPARVSEEERGMAPRRIRNAEEAAKVVVM
jgi:hypothetical protein